MLEQHSVNAENNEIPEEPNAQPLGEQAVGSAEQSDAADSRRAVTPRRRRFIKKISFRTTLNYIMFSVILLVLLWAVFFIALYVFYDRILQRDMDEVGHITTSAFPKNSGEIGIQMFFKYRLPELARTNSVAVVVFTRDGNENEVLLMIDNMGNVADANVTEVDSEVFDAVMSTLNFEKLFLSANKSEKASTDLGTFFCYGSRLEVQTAEGVENLYMLIMKPYEVFNPQTNKIMYLLIICTLIVLVVTCIFSFFASRHQTRQLTDFSQKAKHLADGDYNVVFSGNGYDEYESLALALNSATEKMQRAENLQHDIIANVSHDIRTPLTMIRAYAEMLRDMPADPEKRAKTTNVIISETERLTVLTDDILNYSQLQSGVAEFKFEVCDIALVAQAVLTRFDIFRERDAIEFETDLDKKCMVNCDMHRIEQVLYNLINNALNYCGDDKKVIVKVKKNNDIVRVEVIDHGNGIEAEDIDTVWDRYYRSAHAKRIAVGSGLGLSICKNILTAHSAKYGVISEIGKGTTFWFELDAVKMRGIGLRNKE
ncbi:MAG: HAMP domain-containing histidine kinase [Clostridiales bacterium]|nr:HAMP domain-containing histidine kinase [Clostridiales bacterium]